MIGKTLSHFQLTAKLGEGGMGVVYRATDSRLGREVAVKVLPDGFTDDAERLARFEREARLLAALNHPNVASIHDVDSHEGAHFLVMELVEGETLAERLDRGPVPLADALEIAAQIAEGLESAHERGIVHRDLKPANVKLAPDGTLKILDFGLAKALDETPDEVAPSMTNSPTLTANMTTAGLLMGTAAYMSPEQARGEPADRRSDIWAFGVILMEMLTGRPVWSAGTVSDTLAGILAREADWSSLPKETPSRIRELLERCFEKGARDRLQAIGEARIAIARWQDESTESPEPDPTSSRSTPIWLRLLPWAIAALALGFGLLNRPEVGVELPVHRFKVGEHEAGMEFGPILSPDGARVFLLERTKLSIRDLDQIEPRTHPDLIGISSPFWSPNGKELAYQKDEKLWRLDAETLRERVVASLPEGFRVLSGAWSPSGKIFLSKWRGGLYELSVGGGDLKQILEPDENLVDLHDLILLPDGETLLVNPHETRAVGKLEAIRNGQREEIHVFDRDTNLWGLAYSPAGQLLFSRWGSNPGIYAMSFSTESLEVTGEPRLIAAGGVLPALSSDGKLAYLTRAEGVSTQLVWVDLEGKIVAVEGPPTEDLYTPRVSPDGGRIVYAKATLETWISNIYVYDRVRQTERRLTQGEHDSAGPAWTPDGRQVVFWRRQQMDWDPEKNRIMLMGVEGSREPEDLGQGGGRFTFSPDGGTMVYATWDVRLQQDILKMDLAGDRSPVPVFVGPKRYVNPELSPDGTLLAYQSNESGRSEVYLTRFPSLEGRWQVSQKGGGDPRWSPDGHALYWWQRLMQTEYYGEIRPTTQNAMMAADVSALPEVRLGAPRVLFDMDGADFVLGRGWEVAPDGETFLAVKELSARRSDVIVVQNWAEAFPDLQ